MSCLKRTLERVEYFLSERNNKVLCTICCETNALLNIEEYMQKLPTEAHSSNSSYLTRKLSHKKYEDLEPSILSQQFFISINANSKMAIKACLHM